MVNQVSSRRDLQGVIRGLERLVSGGGAGPDGP
jgi:hypothetical protein